MEAGDVQHIKIGMLHRFTGLEDSAIMEFSTFHMDSDSYRVENSGAVSTEELNNLYNLAYKEFYFRFGYILLALSNAGLSLSQIVFTSAPSVERKFLTTFGPQ